MRAKLAALAILIGCFCAILGFAVLAFFVTDALAAVKPHLVVRKAMAVELVAEAATTPKYAVLSAWCVVNTTAGPAQDPTACLIIAKNGKPGHIFCGFIYTSDATPESHTLLPDTDYSKAVPCRTARKYLKDQGPTVAHLKTAQRALMEYPWGH